jgi:hypothetical protein
LFAKPLLSNDCCIAAVSAVVAKRLVYVPQYISATVSEYGPFFPLWLYIPILGLGRLHETFRFISVTRSRTAGRTPWTGDQLVTRPLLTAAGDCDDEVGGMNGFGRGNRSTRRKPDPTPL